MAKISKAYVCQACGAVTARWSGKCASCGEWNSIIEEQTPSGSPALIAIKGGNPDGSDWKPTDLTQPNKTFTYQAPALTAGTYEFYCTVAGHKEAGMVGTLTVKGS